MLFSLAFKNIKKSIKDYSIYFFTLVMAVSIFYIFNSVGSQQSMMNLTANKVEMITVLVKIIDYLSVFVSVILGFLIIYSNNFLIKRRKKELGLYLTLGMSKSKVSAILVIETLLVGLISLGVGLLIGIIGSQFLSLFVAKLFEADMKDFTFIFSTSAFFKTIVYFGIIFILVMIFNVFNLSRNKLIDLLTASKKNEKVKFRNKYVVTISFLLAIVLLCYAYHLLFNGIFYQLNNDIIKMLLSGALGMLLLFFSISGFSLKIFQLNKKIYFNDLNMFTLKQINSKINTTVISTTIICLMLLLTIGILSGSLSLANMMNSDLEKNNMFDFTIHSFSDEIYEGKIDNYLSDYVIYDISYDGVSVEDILGEKITSKLSNELSNESVGTNAVPVIVESDFNKLMKLENEKTIQLKENEYLILSNFDKQIEYYNLALKNNHKVKFTDSSQNNYYLVPAIKKVVELPIENSINGNSGVFVISDELKEKINLEIYNKVIVGNYKNTNKEEAEKEFFDYIRNNFHDYGYTTKLVEEANSIGTKAMFTFIGLYLGIVFAISSATVLAISELSESSDNKERYKVLKLIGTDYKTINKSLFIQISVAFLLPLIFAIIHAIFGLGEFNKIVKLMASTDLTSNIIVTSLFIIIVYGGYFIATYLVSKNIINEKN